jgi:hypothetical protein
LQEVRVVGVNCRKDHHKAKKGERKRGRRRRGRGGNKSWDWGLQGRQTSDSWLTRLLSEWGLFSLWLVWVVV